jgi:hypothetical protein
MDSRPAARGFTSENVFAKCGRVCLAGSMKWILAAAAAVLVAAFVLMQRNGVKTAYVNGLPAYNQLPGREFILQRDCYIFKFKDRATDWPLLADHAVVPALPEKVEDSRVGTETDQVRILATARVGSLVRIVSVRRDESRTATSITFEVLFLDERDRPYPRVDTFLLLDHSPEKDGKPPQFLARYVVPRDGK